MLKKIVLVVALAIASVASAQARGTSVDNSAAGMNTGSIWGGGCYPGQPNCNR
jgi:hypothetical protein